MEWRGWKNWIRFCELCNFMQLKYIESCIELRLTKKRWRVKFCEQIYSEKIVNLKCIELSLSFAKMATELRRREWIRILYKFRFLGFLDSMNSTFDLASYVFKFKYIESCIKLTLNFTKMGIELRRRGWKEVNSILHKFRFLEMNFFMERIKRSKY